MHDVAMLFTIAGLYSSESLLRTTQNVIISLNTQS